MKTLQATASAAIIWMAFHVAVSEPSNTEITEHMKMKDVVARATRNDAEFQAILIEELRLAYSRDLKLPARDLVLSVKQEFDMFLTADRNETGLNVSLSKLFPRIGTEISATYGVNPSSSSANSSGSAGISIAQPIARNAFGRSTRLLDRIVGLETDVARHQVIEGYEDYLAAIMIAYESWSEAYRKLEVGRSSHSENLKLLDNVKARGRKQIARAVDINKVSIQVLTQKERLIELEEEYKKRLHEIHRTIRHDGKDTILPSRPVAPADPCTNSFASEFSEFVENSRTFIMLRMLEKKSKLELDREADDLLPSINVVLGAGVDGDNYGLTDSDDLWYAGLTVQWSLPDHTGRAEREIAKIDHRKAELSRINARYRLQTTIKNLFHEIKKEKRLLEVADKKIKLAKSILADETENYSFGKVTLNDYIDAVNALDRQRLNKITHEARYAKLVIEWRRLTDVLVGPKRVVKDGPGKDE